MALDPFRLRASPGLRFGKLLGTGTGDSFGPGDADPTRYAALTVWDDAAAAERFEAGPVGRGWARMAAASARLDLRPIASRGRWSGREPFAAPASPRTTAGTDADARPAAGSRPISDGTVLALTRARLRPTRTLTFWRAVPPVVAALRDAPGLLARFGVGEAPIGWQGTVSVWRSAADLVAFAYRRPEHRAAIARTATTHWYAEELFARFAVIGVRGDRSVLGWTDHGHGRGGRA
jgi:heme-degrading monooxygenase HmoA